jgi:hypothetical protein
VITAYEDNYIRIEEGSSPIPMTGCNVQQIEKPEGNL